MALAPEKLVWDMTQQDGQAASPHPEATVAQGDLHLLQEGSDCSKIWAGAWHAAGVQKPFCVCCVCCVCCVWGSGGAGFREPSYSLLTKRSVPSCWSLLCPDRPWSSAFSSG